MTTVLLTGATGFLGQHLLRELVTSGATVRGLSRSPAGDAAVAALGGEPVRGALDDGESLQRATAGCTAVFHTAADTSAWTPNNAAQTETNVGGAQRLLAAAKAAQVAAFVHTSSISAYSHLVHEPLREDVRQRGGESWINYERNKFAVEQLVRGSGLPHIVFQPAHILGPGDRNNWSKLIRIIDREALPGAPPGSGNFADVRQIAKVQVRGWQQQRFGESYLLGGEHIRFLALIQEIGRQLQRKTPQRAMPAWVLKPYARVVDALSRLTGKEPDITPEAAAYTCHDLRVDSGKAERELGYASTPIAQLLADTIVWLRAEKMIR